MTFSRLLLLATALCAGLAAEAHNFGAAELSRAVRTSQINSLEDLKNMSADEITDMIESDGFREWFNSNPAMMMTPVSNAIVTVRVNLREQRLYASSPEGQVSAKVSTGRGGSTPRGCWQAWHMNKNQISRRYNNAPMPYSVFFNGDIAIHKGHLPGYPASHGCVRTTMQMAQWIYAQTGKYGMSNTRICVE
jgi:hypothetical protein